MRTIRNNYKYMGERGGGPSMEEMGIKTEKTRDTKATQESLSAETREEFKARDFEARDKLAEFLRALEANLEIGTAGPEGIPKATIERVAGYAKEAYDRLVALHSELQDHSYQVPKMRGDYDIEMLKNRYARLMKAAGKATEKRWTDNISNRPGHQGM